MLVAAWGGGVPAGCVGMAAAVGERVGLTVGVASARCCGRTVAVASVVGNVSAVAAWLGVAVGVVVSTWPRPSPLSGSVGDVS